ncbi:bromodomain-containing protein 7-like [Haliotis cracherodii]|uniref:bromodomain-containing protein 7-like n=1 Tax=Haliotis cracherodii TaxID=6455 RepID=UPI0039EB5C8F
MGKKHKKHKSEKKSLDAEEGYTQEVVEKPLKLVLKVGGSQPTETIQDVYTHSPHHEEKKHKHKKKKKKKDKDRDKDKDKDRHKHDGEGSSSKRKAETYVGGDESTTVLPPEEPPEKQPHIVVPPPQVVEPVKMEVEEQDVSREPRQCTVQGEDSNAILRQCLHYIQKKLQGKDLNGFFAYPVTDAIAPGYSSIISYPMDFSTILTKIEDDEYRNVMEYKKDFITMCNNAMTYNRPETIYYKEAKRLMQSGLKLLSKEKILNMKKTQSFMANITLEEIGFHENGAVAEMVTVIDEEEQRRKELKKIQKSKSLTRFEAIPDNMSPEQILAQAQAAAKEVKEELTLRKDKSKFGFLRRRKDGATTLTVVNPDNDGKVSETEKIVALGELTGKLTTGSGNLAGFKEDKRNKISPVTYLNYGPFSSYAPQYDSAFSSVSKEESDLLLSTYGDDTGAQYAKSVMSFVESAEDYGVKMVDVLLDVLTKGEHSKTRRLLEQKKKVEADKKAEEEKQKEKEAKVKKNIDFNSLRSLGDLGLDVSFVDYFEKEIGNEKLQARLDQTAGLITDLQQTQKERLSQKPPAHLGLLLGPSDREAELAEKVSKELKALAREAAPKDIVSIKAMRSALGITMQPVVPFPTPNQGISSQPMEVVDSEAAQPQAANEGNDNNTIDTDLHEFLQQGSAVNSVSPAGIETSS